jgi:cytoskeletal protein RodZ
MTNNYPPRKPPRRNATQRGYASSGRGSRSSVGERLRDAREARGVDVYRVERDTKIRAKFLTALEEGDFADLPGDVYTRGFLRNYATYLGLNADELEGEWRAESGGAKLEQPQLIGGPKPMRISRGFVFQRSHIAIIGVVIIVAMVGIYFGYQVTRFLSYPTVGVTSPNAATIVVGAGTTSWKLTGTATPGSTVLVAWDSQDPKTTLADASGHWSFDAILHPGKNQFDITAKNLDTNHASKVQSLVIMVEVVTPPPPSPVVAFSSPADAAVMKSGNVTVAGTSDLVTTVTLTPVLLGPPPAAGTTIVPSTPAPEPEPEPTPASSIPGATSLPTPIPTAPPGPGLVSTKAAADGTFTFSVSLVPGTWRLELGGYNTSGKQAVLVYRTIVVPYKGVNVLIQVKGGPAMVYVYKNGLVENQRLREDGWSYTVVEAKSVCVSSPHQASKVYITVNGKAYGSISSLGGTKAYIGSNGIPIKDAC